jgi:hypothetical protein
MNRVQFPAGGREFSLLHSIHTGCGAHPASHPVGIGGSFLMPEGDHSPPSNAKVKNGGAIPPLPIHLNGVVLN